MGLRYIATEGNQALSFADWFLEIIAPADAAIRLLRFWMEEHTRAGNVQSERVQLKLLHTTVVSDGGPTAITNKGPLIPGAPAPGATVSGADISYESGTRTDLIHRTFEVSVGMDWIFEPGVVFDAPPTEGFVFRLDATLGQSIDFDYGLIWEEIGG